VAQFLLNPDGSVPPGANVAALEAAGVRLVRPSTPPSVKPGEIVVDPADPEFRAGEWWQRWVIEAAPVVAPERVTTISRIAFFERLPIGSQLRYLEAVESHPVAKLVDYKLSLVQQIDLEHPSTIAGVRALESAGVISKDDAAALLRVE
jgi:hypothetical protein